MWEMKGQTYCSGTSPANCELVCNGGFETVSAVPMGRASLGGQTVPLATGWFVTAGGGSPDLFNSGSTLASGASIPCNAIGYQAGHNGSNGYIGLYTNGQYNGNTTGYFEGVERALSGTMQAGKFYDVSLWISKADLSNKQNASLGVFFTDGSSTIGTLTISSTYLNDMNNWVKVSMPYCASGLETNIVIKAWDFPSMTTGATQTTAACTYTAPDGNPFLYVDDISVQEAKFSIVSPTNTACLNSSITVSVTSSCSVNMANYNYSWNFGDGYSVSTGTTNSASHAYSTSGNYTGTLTVSGVAGTYTTCSQTFTFSANIPTISQTITSSTTSVCSGTVSFNSTPSPAGSYTYSWTVSDASTGTVVSVPITGGTTASPTINFTGVYQNVNVCCTITNTMGCTNTSCITLLSCCQTPTNTTKYTNTTFSSNTTITGTSTLKYQFAGTITVSSGTLTIYTAEVTMDPYTKFIVNSGAKLYISESYLHGCQAMWNGIVGQNTSTVQISGSRVDDALRGVVDSVGGLTLSLANNYFNKNKYAVVGKGSKPSTSSYDIKQNLFTCSQVPSPSWHNYVPTAVTLGNATTLSSYSSVNLLPPYQNAKSVAGIELINCNQAGATNSMVTLGAANTGTINLFDKLQMGIHLYRSNALAQNNVFINMSYSINPAPNIAGVYVDGWSGTLACFPPIIPCQITNTISIGTNTTNSNYFVSSDYGVYSTGKVALSVNQNTFATLGTGVYIKENNLNINTTGSNNVSIYRNKIVGSVVGIEIYNNTRGSTSISENRINNTSPYTNANANYQNNFAIRCTEATLSTNPSNFPYYNIYNNLISDYYNGIYTAQTFSTQISDNQIYMLPDNTSLHFQMGINFNNTNNCNVISNQLYCAPSYSPNYSSWWQYGIATSNSAVPRIRCNYVENIPMGMVFNGSNYTTAGDGIIANSLNGHFIGVWLYGNGEIGNQYYTSSGNNYSADNQWTNTNAYQTYVSDGNLTTAPGTSGQSRLYSRSTTGYAVINYFPAVGTSSANPLIGNNVSNTTISCTYSATPNFKISASQVLNSKLMQRGREIAKDCVIYINNAVDINQVDRRHLLRNIKLQELNTGLDNVLNDFMDMVPDENTGLFYQIDSLFSNADSNSIAQAQMINNSIITNNTADALQKQLNNLYIQERTAGLGLSDLQQLEYIALQCPNLYGQAVIQARTIVFQYTHKQYVSECEKPNMSVKDIKARKNMSGQSPDVANVQVYPNPANQELFVEAEGYEQIQIKVYDVMGQLVLDKTVKVNQSINTESLSMGTYIYKVFNQAEILKTGKLIIAK